jgi:predicted RNA binding protein YcfA (HicA-like mRNA interferase family)
MATKIRTILRLLDDDEWYIVNQVGSHRQFKHKVKPVVSLLLVNQATIFRQVL